MYVIKLKRSSHSMTVKHVTRNVSLKHVGRRGPQGNPASNIVTSVQGRIGDVVITELDSKIDSIVAGNNVTVDNTDPLNPIVSAEDNGPSSVENVGTGAEIYKGVSGDTIQLRTIKSGDSTVIITQDGDEIDFSVVPPDSIQQYDAVVHPTEGTHTTVTEAIADGAKTVYVRESTYTESTITSALDGVLIVGESHEAVLDFGANSFTLSGDNIRIYNLKVVMSTGTLTLSGDTPRVDGSILEKTGINSHIISTGSHLSLVSNTIIDTSTQTDTPHISFMGGFAKMIDNDILYAGGGSTISTAYLSGTIACYQLLFQGNRVTKTAGGGIALGVAFADGHIVTNAFNGANTSGTTIVMGDYNMIITGNYATAYTYFLGTEGVFDKREFLIEGNTLLGMSNPFNFDGVHDCQILGNYLGSTNKSIFTDCYNLMVQANHIRGANAGLAFFGLPATNKDNIITGNTFTNGATLYDEGDNIYHTNVGITGTRLKDDLNMNSHKVTSVTDPTAPQDAATKAYVDTQVSSVEGSDVDSFNGRTGTVVPASGDYAATQITNTPAGNIAATTSQGAINELDTEKVAKSGDVMTGDLTTSGAIMASGNYSPTASVAGVYIGIPNTLNPRFTIVPASGDVRAIDNSGGSLRFVNSTQGTVQLLQSGSNFELGANITPTHTLTIPSVGTGIVHYNTVNQTTDYERVRMAWVANVFTMQLEKAGTGTDRTMQIGGTSSNILLGEGATPAIKFTRGTTNSQASPIFQFTATSLTATSGVQTGLAILPTLNQTVTAGYTALLVNPTETSVGSGSKLLADFQVGGVSKANINNLGYFIAPRVYLNSTAYFEGAAAGTANMGAGMLGILATGGAATHSLTLGSTSTGIALYNTSDQTTNYERGRIRWNSNELQIGTESGGSGTTRVIKLSANLFGVGELQINNTSTNGIVRIFLNSATAGAIVQSVGATFTASGGVQYGLSIAPTINQTVTAGYTALLVNPTETGTGSGVKLLADFQVGGVSKARIDNGGQVIATTFRATSSIVNDASFNNASIAMATTGITISRNIADANHALIVDLIHASSTGKILDLRFGGVSKASFTNLGMFQATAGTTSTASLNIATGVAPTSPNNGDIWFDGTDIKMRVGGVTKTFTLV